MAKVSLRAYNREIETMIDSGHLDGAIANCRHILKAFPKHLETYRLLGKAYLEYKRYPEAVDIFSRVLAAIPDDFVANVGMSIIRDEENKLDDAIWHMERAFETQPSNAAIQSELQRLYGRRDGVQPPRIRMTRGALAHMYVQGELYPQAISEIKSVLKEDGGRVDMQALLARACYRSGLKNEAADVASSVLRMYPYCLDANRVLLEILGSDRSEGAQLYRQRVVELDPYAAHVMGTVFQSNEAPEAAVNVERLDWNGQPVSLQPDWGTQQAITLEEDSTKEEQPEWLRSVFEEPLTQPPPQPLGPIQDQPRVVPAFDTSLPTASTGEPKEEIPDFLREAGWGKSTGTFDESKSASAYEEPETEPPIAKGELPDWVKAMAPVEAQQPAEEEEELPDWINKIGTGTSAVSSDSDNQLDWIRQLDQPAQAQPSESQPDWLNELSPSEASGPSASEDTPDWLKGPGGESESTPASTPAEQHEWTSQLEQPTQAQPESQAPDDQLDWLKQFEQTEQAGVMGVDEQPDWLKGLGPESAPVPQSTEQTDWSSQPEQPVASASDDQPDWLKGLDSESERTPTGELDWLKAIGEQAEPAQSEASPVEARPLDQEVQPTAATPAFNEMDFLDEKEEQIVEPTSQLSDRSLREGSTEEPQQPVPSEAASSAVGIDNLGISEQERDDSFAWLEGLAARQGASEGLLTKPEERMEEEPDWVKRAKGLSTDEVPKQPAPSLQPSANVEELGTSEQERDDSFAWLEGLAARQGASEGLLTKPEERMEEEPDWVKRAKDLSQAAEQPLASAPATEEPSSKDDTGVWLRSLEEEEPTDEPVSQKDATGIWLKSLDEGLVEFQSEQPAEKHEPDIPEWMQNIHEEQTTDIGVQAGAEEEVASAASDWMRSTEEPAQVQAEGSTEQVEAELPAWMQSVEAEESVQTSASPVAAEKAAPEASDWMRSTEEPAEAQPMQATEQPHEEIPAWMQDIRAEESVQVNAASVAAEEVAAEPSDWMRSTEEPAEVQAVQPPEQSEAETPAWMQDIAEGQQAEASISSVAAEETAAEATEQLETETPAWMPSREAEKAAEPEPVMPASEIDVGTRETEAEQPAPVDELPEWMQFIEDRESAEASGPATAVEEMAAEGTEWMGAIEQPATRTEPAELAEERLTAEEEIPAWLSSLDEEETRVNIPASSDADLPAWLRGEEEAPPEPLELEPTRAADWQPVQEQQAEPSLPESEVASETLAAAEETPEPAVSGLEGQEAPASIPEPEPHKEPVAPIDETISTLPVDPILGQAREALSKGDISSGLSTYGKLIKKTRLLDEVIYDLREALYRYPVDVGIWQSLGDAYMRANRLQDALDAYTKAEELLR